MYVEDLVFQFANLDVPWSSWHLDFIHNVSERVQSAQPLSVKQAKVLLDTARRHRHRLIERIEPQVLDKLLAEPIYRLPPYLRPVVPREVRYLGSNRLAFRFSPDDIVRETIKQMQPSARTPGQRPVFNRQYNLWIVSVDRQTLHPILLLISNHRFQADQATLEYLALAERSRNKPSSADLTADGEVIHVTVRDNPWLAAWMLEIAAGIDL